MFLYTDHGNYYEECLECSYSTELKIIPEFQRLPPQLQKELALLVECSYDNLCTT
jgi:hypothetical protein